MLCVQGMQAPSPERATYHVLPAVRGWKVQASDGARPLSLADDRQQALHFALSIRRHDEAVVVHDANGDIEEVLPRLML